MITPGLLGALSPFDGPIDPPAGLPAAPTRVAVVITWFGLPGPPAIAGWTLAGWTTDARGIDPTFTALFFLDVADGSAVAAVTPTGISGWLGQMVSIDGDIDAAFDVATQANQVLDTVAPGPLAATDDGSFLLVACGCWNFAAWQASGFGGAQLYPPGFVPTLGPANATELGGFYLDAIPVGAIDTTFGADVERFAVVAALFKPAAPPPPPGPVMGKLTTSAPVGSNISLASTNQQPLQILVAADDVEPTEGPPGSIMLLRNGALFAAPTNYVLGTDPGGDIQIASDGAGNWSLPDSTQARLTYGGAAGKRFLVQFAGYLNADGGIGPVICAACIAHNNDVNGLGVDNASAVAAGRIAGQVLAGDGHWIQAQRITPPLTPGDTVALYFAGSNAGDRTFMSGTMTLVEVNTL